MTRNPDDPEDAGIAPELTRLDVLDVSTLQDKPVPDRDWLWLNWIPMRVASGLYADGGWGKSTWMQQLCTCSAANKPFLGNYVRRCKSLIFECEDDTDEFHRRQATINAHLGIDFADLE